METKRPEYNGDRLTLNDMGVTSADTGVSREELEALKPAPDNVLQMSDYRKPVPEPERDTQLTSQPITDNEAAHSRNKANRNKMIKAGLLAGATILGATKLTYETFREKVHPAPRAMSLDSLNSAQLVDVDGIKPGDELTVSPYSFVITGGNVRTSPSVAIKDENLVQHTDLSGLVVTHPEVVPDSKDPANGNWYVFYDAAGQKLAINEQNISYFADGTPPNTPDIKVTVNNATNMGIIAHDSNNVTMQVATIVQVTS